MAYRTDHRNGTTVDLVSQLLVVKAEQILHGSPASSDDQQIQWILGSLSHRSPQTSWRFFSLNQCPVYPQLYQGIAAGQDLNDVLKSGSAGRGDHADGFWEPRQWLFHRRIKQTSRRQFFL